MSSPYARRGSRELLRRRREQPEPVESDSKRIHDRGVVKGEGRSRHDMRIYEIEEFGVEIYGIELQLALSSEATAGVGHPRAQRVSFLTRDSLAAFLTFRLPWPRFLHSMAAFLTFHGRVSYIE